MVNFSLGNKMIGSGCPTFIIAEVALAHDGSLGAAHSYIEAVSKTGVNAIKFQTHFAEYESSKFEQFRVNIFPQDETRYDYWKRTEFTETQWKGLFDHAADVGLIFLSTPFSTKAVDVLENIGVVAWKIGSGDLCNQQLIDYLLKTKKPIFLSTGMASFSEIDSAYKKMIEAGIEFALFQCTSEYPCPPENIGLNVLTEFKNRYSCPIGLSDHSGVIYPSLSAVTLGVNLLELHVVFSRDCFGPDVKSSLTITELQELVRGVRYVEKMTSNIVDKDLEAIKKSELKKLFGRSVFYSKNVVPGQALTMKDLILKKPAIGIEENLIEKLLGRVIKVSRSAGDLLRLEDFE